MLYENTSLRMEGIIIGFDEYMNLVSACASCPSPYPLPCVPVRRVCVSFGPSLCLCASVVYGAGIGRCVGSGRQAQIAKEPWARHAQRRQHHRHLQCTGGLSTEFSPSLYSLSLSRFVSLLALKRACFFIVACCSFLTIAAAAIVVYHFFVFLPAASAVMRVERSGCRVSFEAPSSNPPLAAAFLSQEDSWRSHNPPSFIVSNVNAGSVGESRTKDTPL